MIFFVESSVTSYCPVCGDPLIYRDTCKRIMQQLRRPMGDQDFLEENKDLMCQDGMGVYHCLLVTGEGGTDGLLVESEGGHYARYASYVSEATALRYPSLAKMNQELADAVNLIAAYGASQTTDGSWIILFDEWEKEAGLCVEGKPFLQGLIGEMLSERPEVVGLTIRDGGFQVGYDPKVCPKAHDHPLAAPSAGTLQPAAPRQTLGGLIQTAMEDVHLLHKDVEVAPATIAELSAATLTVAGKQEWSDVLNAQVCRIYQGIYGLQVELDGVEPSRIRKFSGMLAGFCSEENHEKWVAQPKESQASSPKMWL